MAGVEVPKLAPKAAGADLSEEAWEVAVQLDMQGLTRILVDTSVSWLSAVTLWFPPHFMLYCSIFLQGLLSCGFVVFYDSGFRVFCWYTYLVSMFAYCSSLSFLLNIPPGEQPARLAPMARALAHQKDRM